VDEVRTVTDTAILDALRALAAMARLIVEPAGAAAVAGLAGLDLKPPVVAILTGANVDQHQLGRWLSMQ
jgi:threonine dehydratase